MLANTFYHILSYPDSDIVQFSASQNVVLKVLRAIILIDISKPEEKISIKLHIQRLDNNIK